MGVEEEIRWAVILMTSEMKCWYVHYHDGLGGLSKLKTVEPPAWTTHLGQLGGEQTCVIITAFHINCLIHFSTA